MGDRDLVDVVHPELLAQLRRAQAKAESKATGGRSLSRWSYYSHSFGLSQLGTDEGFNLQAAFQTLL